MIHLFEGDTTDLVQCIALSLAGSKYKEQFRDLLYDNKAVDGGTKLCKERLEAFEKSFMDRFNSAEEAVIEDCHIDEHLRRFWLSKVVVFVGKEKGFAELLASDYLIYCVTGHRMLNGHSELNCMSFKKMVDKFWWTMQVTLTEFNYSFGK